MGVQFLADGVDAEAYVTEYSPPVRRAVEAIHFTNNSLAKAVRNYVKGKAQGSVVGTPVVLADRVTCNSLTNFLQLGVQEPSQLTLFLIARSGDANSSGATRPGFVGTYDGLAADGGAADGLAMFFSGNGQVSVNAGYGNTASDKTFPRANLSAADAASWALYSIIVSTAGIIFTDHTNNRTVTQSTTGGLPRRPTVNKLRLGSLFKDYAGSCDVAALQLHSAVLTASEQALTVADLRAYAARKGIKV
ncbi:hypothetical protein IAE33_000238 [Pseudomonas sp. S60]|uniref:hypothetical protein n=1 Tax=Pseudomonas sp. S60 TaxID=211124 RepID=UPI00191268AA|nr:hypothetical protein [Pseudomonas sp. S60]MBK5008378.1 hypothetical protein [Pseudomonas sp. S60]